MKAKCYRVKGVKHWCFDGPPSWSDAKGSPDTSKSSRKAPTIKDDDGNGVRGHCSGCEKNYGPLTKHHIIPRTQGGDNMSSNTMLLCKPCHDFIEQLTPLPMSRSGIKNALCEFAATKSSGRDELCRRHGDWHKWVYGGHYPSFTCNCK